MSAAVDSESIGLPERTAAIQSLAGQVLTLAPDQIISVSEFNCGKPTCPNIHTVIMVMSQDGPQKKIVINKPIVDIVEFDVLDACMDSLRESSG